MNLRSRRRAVVAVLSMALAAGLTACGDDDEESAADVSDACEAQAGVVAGFNTMFSALPPPPDGPPSPEFAGQVRSAFDSSVAVPLGALVTSAPDEIRDEVEEISRTMRQFRDDADVSAIDDDEFDELTRTVDAFLQDNCTGAKATVEADEYAYDGLPPTLPAGTVRVELENTGDEAHEMIVLVRQPGVTETYDQILALPDDQIEGKVDFVGGTSANPDGTSYLVASMPVGDYLFVCTFGKGTTDDEDPADGEPHFTLGMKQEVKVA